MKKIAKIIGITGGLATGKSYVSRILLENLGNKAILFDADKMVHELFIHNQEVINLIGKQFPAVVKKQQIDRGFLGEIVFNDPQKLTKLEQIIHPFVEEELKKHFEQNTSDFIILDVPLLFETNLHKYCQHIILTICERKVQIKRVEARGNNLSRLEIVEQRMLKEEDKKQLANFIIDTTLPENDFKDYMQNIITKIKDKS